MDNSFNPWAYILGGTSTFQFIPNGGRFTFPNSTEILTKRNNRGWYEDATGKKYRTGVNTAVKGVFNG